MIVPNPFIHSVFLIFTGAALLATLALYTRQSLLVAYIFLGVILGPPGLGWVSDVNLIHQFADFGIIFLLFLMGLHLQPQNLLSMLKNATLVTLLSSISFAILGAAAAYLLGFEPMENFVIGAAMMFSSTIIGLKLLPTTVLHHQHIGEVVISVLLLQDLIAILSLLILTGMGSSSDGVSFNDCAMIVLALPSVVMFSFLAERFILRPLIKRFDRIQEYIFLIALGWCLGIAQLAEVAGLSYNIGAFIGGVSLAASPIAMYIAESLKPLRDFFLILFFFTLGARVQLEVMPDVLLPSSLLAVVTLLLKPAVFGLLLSKTRESRALAVEVGIRLGQLSEFSLLMAYLAFETSLIGARASYTIQAATLFTFIASSYFVVLKFPTPIAVSSSLRRD